MDNDWPITAYAYVINTFSGTLTVNNADVYGKGNGSFGLIGGTATIVTGTFSVDGEYSHYALYNSGCNATVLGGTFTKVESSASQNLIYASGNGTTAISGGTFATPKKDFISVVGDTASVSISGGYFSAPVADGYCAEGYIPGSNTDAATKANYPYTVIGDIVYPVDSETAGVPVPVAWIKDNTELIGAAIDLDAVIAGLAQNGANGVPLWQSYVLGFNPKVATSKLVVGASAPVATATGYEVTVKGLNVNIPSTLDSGTTVAFHLEEATPAGAAEGVWTARSEPVAVVEGQPQATVKIDAVAGKLLRIVADIVTVAK